MCVCVCRCRCGRLRVDRYFHGCGLRKAGRVCTPLLHRRHRPDVTVLCSDIAARFVLARCLGMAGCVWHAARQWCGEIRKLHSKPSKSLNVMCHSHNIIIHSPLIRSSYHQFKTCNFKVICARVVGGGHCQVVFLFYPHKHSPYRATYKAPTAHAVIIHSIPAAM
jgi:hypothetical protein